jgi:hypothetical protein
MFINLHRQPPSDRDWNGDMLWSAGFTTAKYSGLPKALKTSPAVCNVETVTPPNDHPSDPT